MKLCKKCNQLKTLEEFSKNSSKRDGLQSNCKTCCRAKQKIHYQNNKAYYNAKSKVSVNRNKDYVTAFKQKSKCVKCGEERHYLLDFHHVDPSTKIESITVLAHFGGSLKLLKEEMDKCILLCSNCHRELHYLER